MTRRPSATPVLLITGLCLLVAGVLWALWSSPDAPDREPIAAAAGEESPFPGAGEDRAVVEPAARPPTALASPDPDSAADRQLPPKRRPTLGIPAAQRAQMGAKTTSSNVQLEEVKRRSLEAWDRHLAPLLYPEGHPLAGTYRDSVTLEDAVAAQVDYWGELTPAGYLDRPMLHVEKRIPYRILNEQMDTLDLTDLDSVRRFYDWAQEQPEDPTAYPADLWLPARPGDPEATNHAEDLAGRIREIESDNFPDAAP